MNEMPDSHVPPVRGITDDVSLYGSGIEITANMLILVPGPSLGEEDPPQPRLTENPKFEKPIIEVPPTKYFAFIKNVMVADATGHVLSVRWIYEKT